MADIGKPTVFNPPEKSRTYWFFNDKWIGVKLGNVVELVVRPSGTHRLKTSDGHFHIIPTGWFHIDLDMEDWTV